MAAASDELPVELAEQLQRFEAQIRMVRQKLEPVLNIPTSAAKETMPPLDRAKLHVALAYTVNALFYSMQQVL